MPRPGNGRTPEIGIALLALLVLLPAVAQPFSHDDLNSIYQAALSWHRPAHLLDPWMGGLLRMVPKALLMGLVLVAGPHAWPYRFLNAGITGLSVYLLVRTLAERSGSRPVGLWSGALFAAGFAWYAAAAIQISNITIVSALLFLLAAWRLAQRGKRPAAIACFALAALCHEGAWAAFLFLPFAMRSEIPPAFRYALAASLMLFGVGALLPGQPGTYCATEMQYWAFAIVPLNATLAGSQPFPGGLAHLAAGIVAMRPWAGFLALALLLAVSLRARGAAAAAVAWCLVFTLPFAAAITFWPEVWPAHWLSRRYLYVPAVGLCWLAALLIMVLRPIPRRVLATLLLLWSLAWTGLTIWGAGREAVSPAQVQARADWAREMGMLDARWKTR